MDMKTYFMNNGDFDVRAMLTMGVSAKSDDDAIGFFGTGFKYAIAIILRHGGTVDVRTVSGTYKFTARNESIRGKEFQIVYMNDREAGFTTHLGANWEPWMAYRELYCNAVDEGGVVSDSPEQYDTVIEVNCSEIAKIRSNHSMYFLSDKEPDYQHSEIEIFKEPLPFVYYRGIAVLNSPNGATFGYNIKRNLALTEDRTMRNEYEFHGAALRAIMACDNRPLLRQCLKQGNQLEAMFGYEHWAETASNDFIHVCGELLKSNAGICDSALKAYKKVKKETCDWPEFQATQVQQAMIDRALKFLAALDITAAEYPIKTVTGMGEGVMGRAHERTIYLSEIPFNLGTKQVASTIMEEWVHLKFGCEDFDRQMQSWLFDKILSLGENINGQPI